MATTITWAHSNAIGDATGVAKVALLLPASLTSFGAFAEPKRGSTSGSADHTTCTPTDYVGHSDTKVQLLGTFPEVSGTDVTVNFLFKTEPGQVIRAHVWTVTA